MIEIANNGPDIEFTNYWATEHASAGLCYLSVNAGTLRLLVPAAAEGLIAEMKTGKRASIEPSMHDPRCIDIVFDDGTDSPFSLAIDPKQIDRALGKNGVAALTVWTSRGRELRLQCEIKL